MVHIYKHRQAEDKAIFKFRVHYAQAELGGQWMGRFVCVYTKKCWSVSSTTSAAGGLTGEMETEHKSQTTHKWPSSQQLWGED